MNRLLVIAFCYACVHGRIAEVHKSNEITHSPRYSNDKEKPIQIDQVNVTESSVLLTENTTENAFEMSHKPAPIINNTSSLNNESADAKKTVADYGERLILTPLIKKGKLKEARKASKVNPEMFFGLPSHSGFLTVDERYNSNLFFWYFPVPEKSVRETPWLIWLQGGPGASFMTGLFDEIGPVTVNKDFVLKLRNESWGAEHSLLFIENPVGTGFSFTDDELGYAHHINTSSAHLYVAVQQFLVVFPELRDAALFIAGESYAGKYVPGLAAEIHRRRDPAEAPINLQGLAIGNGFIEPSAIANYSRVAYNFGLIDADAASELRVMENDIMKLVAANQSVPAKHKWQDTIITLHVMASQNQLYNSLKDDLGLRRYEAFLKRADVRRALHVGSTPFHFVNASVNEEYAPDFLSNSQPVLENLLEHYRVLIYSGQLDMMIPYVLTEENLRTWSWSGREQFLAASRHPWTSNGKLAGFHKSGGNLTEVMVRGAGHTAPADQPGHMKELLETFVRGRSLSGRASSTFERRAYLKIMRAEHIFYL